jgi:DNA replication protein DnaC
MSNVSSQAEAACPICGGTGWRDVARGKEREVVRCECRVRNRGERLLAAAKIPARYQHCELNTFRYDPDDKEQKSIAAAKFLAGRFVEEYPTDKTGLLFVGSVGVGKTHLAVGILKALIRDKGVPCLFCDYRELLKSIQNSYNASVQASEMDILRPVFDVEVLVLDELGAVRSTEWVFDTVNYILNSRYNDNKTTIITTNYPDQPSRGSDPKEDDPLTDAAARRSARPESLGDRIGDRMWSRLHEMCKKVDMEGRDYRLHSKKAHFQPIEAPARIRVRGKKESG